MRGGDNEPLFHRSSLIINNNNPNGDDNSNCTSATAFLSLSTLVVCGRAPAGPREPALGVLSCIQPRARRAETPALPSSRLRCVGASCGPCNTRPPNGWLEAEMCCVTVLEARSLKSKCGRGGLLPKAPRENLSPASLPASGALWRPHLSRLCLSLHMAFFLCPKPLLFSYKDTCHWG